MKTVWYVMVLCHNGFGLSFVYGHLPGKEEIKERILAEFLNHSSKWDKTRETLLNLVDTGYYICNETSFYE
jgi:hypothetical protein